MTDNASNPFYDAWLSSSEQLLKVQQSWFDNFNITSPETVDASDVIERAKQNWDQCEAQFNSWVSAADQWSSSKPFFNESGSDDSSGAFEKLKRLLNPETFLRSGVDEINQVFKRYAEGPDFADIGVLEKKFMRTSQDWLNLRNASAEYQMVITKAWAQAFDIYTKEVSNQPEESTANAHEMMQLWLKIANDCLIQVQRSDEFLKAQRKLFKTNTQYKLKQREIIEAWCENFTMPTRTEVDDLHRMVYELRREVRQLKVQLKSKTEWQSPASQVDAVKAKPEAVKAKPKQVRSTKAQSKKATKRRVVKKSAKKETSKVSKKTI